MLPGLIDGHVHTMSGPSGLQYQMLLGVANAQRDLNAGFTTVVEMGSHGGWFGTVELKKAIDSGLVKGPRMQVSGPVLSITKPLNASFPLNFKPAEADLVADIVICDGTTCPPMPHHLSELTPRGGGKTPRSYSP